MDFSHPHHNMLHIPGGTFLMGSREDDSEADDDEKPQHEVTVSDFEMAEYMVTQDLWKQVMGHNPSDFEGKYRPVDSVSWFDAIAFCNRLSREAGLPCVYFTDKACRLPFALDGEVPEEGVVFMQKNNPGYRLPTEAEWEYAARGGQCFGEDLLYAGGDNMTCLGWYNDNSGSETSEVGLMGPNALGFCDMSGNLLEWCWDWFTEYGKEYPLDPTGPEKGGDRLLRGGDWGWDGRGCRAAYRCPGDPGRRDPGVGFRLVCSLAV